MSILKKLTSLIATISIILPLAGCGNKTPEVDYASQLNVSEEPTKGYIWEATKAGKTIHLIGTKHPAPPNVNFFNDKLNEVISNADVLGVELDITDSALLKEAQTLLNEQYISKDGSAKERLSAEEFAKLEEITKDLDISYGQIKNFSDTGISAMISAITMQKLGYTGTSFDEQLIEKFKKEGKNVVSLETPKIQVDAVHTAQAIHCLDKFLLDYDSSTYLQNQSEIGKAGFDAYVNHDMVYPERYMNDERAKFKEKGTLEIFDEMNKKRNVGMVEKINEYINEDKKYVIATGYMHFFGEDSILKLLEADGYAITDLIE